jgi:hypothetical protein
LRNNSGFDRRNDSHGLSLLSRRASSGILKEKLPQALCDVKYFVAIDLQCDC